MLNCFSDSFFPLYIQLPERSLDIFVWPSLPDCTLLPSFSSNVKSKNNALTAYYTKLF